jgi:hypothetical protein
LTLFSERLFSGAKACPEREPKRTFFPAGITKGGVKYQIFDLLL